MERERMKKITCILCGSNEQQPLYIKGDKMTIGQFGFETHPAICSCGFVFLNPRHSEEWYTKFYKKDYDKYYRLEAKKDYGIQGVINNANEIIDRIKKYVNTPDLNILDIGCGSGTMLKQFGNEFNTNNIYGIESSETCIQYVESKHIGGMVISSDMNTNWVENYTGFFDLIIMRHVLEHTFHPIEVLKHIKKSIKSDGLIYIAVPDMLKPRIQLRDYTDWWNYWFRVVHTYYFSHETLSQVLHESGFNQKKYGLENEEVWSLAKNNLGGDIKRSLDPKLYDKQIDILNRLLP